MYVCMYVYKQNIYTYKYIYIYIYIYLFIRVFYVFLCIHVFTWVRVSDTVYKQQQEVNKNCFHKSRQTDFAVLLPPWPLPSSESLTPTPWMRAPLFWDFVSSSGRKAWAFATPKRKRAPIPTRGLPGINSIQ